MEVWEGGTCWRERVTRSCPLTSLQSMPLRCAVMPPHLPPPSSRSDPSTLASLPQGGEEKERRWFRHTVRPSLPPSPVVVMYYPARVRSLSTRFSHFRFSQSPPDDCSCPLVPYSSPDSPISGFPSHPRPSPCW
eukprot:Hpha_TRINITY_DN15520_c0_g1::TRINITY_DN15520_c0_g1_i1::g.104326::m.104326